ncbi:hypothetical protein OF820_00955 [Oceanotoga sp. DSM 15011]|jgi:hypothetical protein|uniref:Uncharacterized protein n=1 Tax=Oceanotoga teriensis TaxID=515440 RepID=A0AA45C975_9BACT|nr:MULTISPECIES: hypothetical protein [Oceanotoga]MDN5341628.1 hypothetical protein [Oceanotoga sp.]MDO7977169.1 hypothetical protein [Oceanotoga teriensis]PWJ96560.1 hypothetical protein C7380_101133 [Oceanotoga teriensis]UYP00266.1 hypothetical protein OF820_00955 [Oceanotoga sp. DSM 15011]
MDNFTKELNELIELKYIIDAYAMYKKGKGKVPVEEIYINNKIKESLDDLLIKDKGFIVKNTDEIEVDAIPPEIDAADILTIIESLEEMGFFTEYVFSKDMSEMFIKVKKVKDINY